MSEPLRLAPSPDGRRHEAAVPVARTPRAVPVTPAPERRGLFRRRPRRDAFGRALQPRGSRRDPFGRANSGWPHRYR